MHFEVLVEDKSASIAIGYMLEKILGPNNARHTWRVIPYKGLGRIPKGLGKTSANKRILLDASLCCSGVMDDGPIRRRAPLWSWWMRTTETVWSLSKNCWMSSHNASRDQGHCFGSPSRRARLGCLATGVRCWPRIRRLDEPFWTLTCRIASAVHGKCSVLRCRPSEREVICSAGPSPGSPSAAGRKPSRHTWMWMRMRRRVFVRFVTASERWRMTQPDWTCIAAPRRARLRLIAGIAQPVEHNLAKVGVAGSSPVSRSSSATRLAHPCVRAHPPARGRATSPCRRRCGLRPPQQPG